MKARFCPKCKSINVKIRMVPPNISILIRSKWVCLDCGYESECFPEKEIKINKKVKKK